MKISRVLFFPLVFILILIFFLSSNECSPPPPPPPAVHLLLSLSRRPASLYYYYCFVYNVYECARETPSSSSSSRFYFLAVCINIHFNILLYLQIVWRAHTLLTITIAFKVVPSHRDPTRTRRVQYVHIYM